MTSEQKAENARLRAVGRIPAETLSYLASIKRRRQKKTTFPYRRGLAAYFMAGVIVLTSKGFLPIRTAKLLVALGALIFIVDFFSFISEYALRKKLLFGWLAKTTT